MKDLRAVSAAIKKIKENYKIRTKSILDLDS